MEYFKQDQYGERIIVLANWEMAGTVALDTKFKEVEVFTSKGQGAGRIKMDQISTTTDLYSFCKRTGFHKVKFDLGVADGYYDQSEIESELHEMLNTINQFK